MSIPRFTLADDEFKKRFINGDLIIDFTEIVLTQNGTKDPQIYRLAGSISATPATGIGARLVWHRPADQPYDMLADLKETFSQKSGVLYGENKYFSLRATDVNGRVWTNPAALVDTEHHADADTVTMRCAFIVCEDGVDASTTEAHLVFMDDLDFPKNVGLHSSRLIRGQVTTGIRMAGFSADVEALRIHFDPRDDLDDAKFSELFAEARKGLSAPLGFDERLLEAVIFCTATMAHPVMTETVHGGKRKLLLAKHRQPNKGIVEPPLRALGHDADFANLMACYYRYSCANATKDDFAPLTRKVGGLFTLGNVWLGTVALLLAVAVESILDEEPFRKIGKPDKGLMAEIDKIFDWLRQAPVAKALLARAEGSLGGLKSSRAKDKLHALVEARAIEEADRKAWSELRNPAAHGTFDSDGKDFQRLVDTVYRISTLINKLVFLKIGYNGKFSDRSSHGWGERDFAADAYLKTIGAAAPVAPTASPKAPA